MKVILSALLMAFLSINSVIAQGQLLFEENFEYDAGEALTDNGWADHSGTASPILAVAPGLTFDDYMGSGIGNAAGIVANGQDVNHTFTSQTSGVVYAAFIIKTGTTNSVGYFFHLGQGTIGSAFFSRVWVNSTGNGVGIGTNAPSAYTGIVAGEPTLIVVKYDISTKVSSLYVFSSFPQSEPETANATFTETANISNVGSVALRQYNDNQNIIIDGIRIATTWDKAVAAGSSTDPSLTISSPANNSTVYANQVDVAFALRNFVIDGDTPDGQVAYKLGENGIISYTSASPVTISGLELGTNTIYFELVDTDGASLATPVTAELTVNYEIPVTEISIISPVDGSTLYTQDVEIEFAVENFVIGENDGKVKYIIDDSAPSYTTVSPISLAGLLYGTHALTLELVNNDEASLEPPVTTSITFTCEEIVETIYILVTSANEVVNGGKYLFVGEKDESFYALGWQKSANRHGVPVSILGNSISVMPAAEVTSEQDNIFPYEITFEETSNGFALYDFLNGKYLAPRTGSNNGLILSDSQVDWTVSVGQDNIVSIVGNSTDYDRRTMRFNQNGSSDPLFACYASESQTGFYLYKALEGNDPLIVITSPYEGEVLDDTDINVEFQIFNFDLNVDGKVKYTINENESEFITSGPLNFSAVWNSSYNVELELVDIDENSLSPEVKASVTFFVGDGVYVDENISGQIKIYPNPASDNIIIETPEDADNISVVNIMGQTVMEIVPVSDIQIIDADNMEAGIYFIKIRRNLTTETHKIIIK